MSKVNVAVPIDTFEVLKALKKETDIPMSRLISQAVKLLVEARNKQLGNGKG